jgi:hypothetical protein
MKLGLSIIINLNRRVCRKLELMFPSFFGSASYKELLNTKINDTINRMQLDSSINSDMVVLDVGGIDRPLLKKSQKYLYYGLDIEYRNKCDVVYDTFIVQSIEKPIPCKVNLIISYTLMEHVRDNETAVLEMFKALFEGGECHHYIPSKWHPYSMGLRLFGYKIQK